jgi:dimethylamine/trimethylamine dehydrogenase
MVDQIRKGVQDFIGAARPSIADPFLPTKIREGRTDEIRECIGCNICRAANNEGVGLRCTQNPTMGEEWRRGWHPERIAAYPRRETALVVGAGPAGLEAALTLARRGLEVTLAEAGRQLGGRIVHEAALPGLATWGRVRDWRLTMLGKLPNVQIFRESRMEAGDIVELKPDHVVLATGSHWRRDGIGVVGMDAGDYPQALTPDDVFAGAEVGPSVTIYDDEHYHMGGAMAEKLARAGHKVTLVTPYPQVSGWTVYTDEQGLVQDRLMGIGVKIVPQHMLSGQGPGLVRIACGTTGAVREIASDTLMLVTGRQPVDTLWLDLAGYPNLARVGDCLAPSSIADAVHSAHRFARLLGEPDLPPRRERPSHRSL